jgi:hypothetical protein
MQQMRDQSYMLLDFRASETGLHVQRARKSKDAGVSRPDVWRKPRLGRLKVEPIRDFILDP